LPLAVVALVAGIVTSQTPSPPPPPQPRFSEGVEVERVVIDARVLTSRGEAIVGLGPDDFRVRVDGRDVALESADWVPGSVPAELDPRAGQAPLEATDVPLPGRLILLVFEKDLESSRVLGFLRMLHRAEELIGTLRPEDRVAIASFDSHLKLWLDFTAQHERALPLLERGLVFEDVPQAEPGPPPSLAAFFDPQAARDAANLEQALLVLGRALSPLPGAKSVVLFCAGMGRLTPVGVVLDSAYEPALQALGAAQATVFSLDVTDADHHSLEVGLKQVAADTGGFYARTHDFPGSALARLEGALEGRYVLGFPRPEGRRGVHEIRIDLVGRSGSVVSRTRYVD
jgi:VWFA-related protein